MDQSFITNYLAKRVRTKKMLRMATRTKSVGTETPIKSMDKKMRARKTRRRRTKEVKKVRTKALRVDKEERRRAREGRRILET